MTRQDKALIEASLSGDSILDAYPGIFYARKAEPPPEFHPVKGGNHSTLRQEPADYDRIGCGCCTGHVERVTEHGLTYDKRTDRCVCHFHQDTPRGNPPRTCSRHSQTEEK